MLLVAPVTVRLVKYHLMSASRADSNFKHLHAVIRTFGVLWGGSWSILDPRVVADMSLPHAGLGFRQPKNIGIGFQAFGSARNLPQSIS